MKNISLDFIFSDEKIEYYAILPFNAYDVINPRLLPEDSKNVIVFLIPYRTDREENNPLAHFARIRDYHGFAKELFSRLIPKLSSLYPDNKFFGFADHSPLNERKLAERSGLGSVGKNGLLLNEKYGSYVFIGEIITTANLESRIFPKKEVCLDCGLCEKECPKKEECISAISQKKRKTEDDLKILKETNTVWGCDICQEICPLNKNSPLSPFEYFYKDKISNFHDILKMDEDTFNSYSFSYRGRKTITENIQNISKKDID